MEKKLYVAYGSNLNMEQMGCRCPEADFYGRGVIRDYELQFKGKREFAFATIAPKEGMFVPAAVWEVSPGDEASLDRYEGYPLMYSKEKIPVNVGGKEVEAFVYVMNPDMKFGLPSGRYYETVREGYQDCGLDVSILNRAVRDSAKACGLPAPWFLLDTMSGHEGAACRGKRDLEKEVECGPMNGSRLSL